MATLDLPRIYAAANAINQDRRQSRFDDLRESATRQQLSQQQTTFDQGQQDRATEQEVRNAKEGFLTAHAIELSDDPLSDAQQYAPGLIKIYESKNGAGSFSQLTPEAVRAIAKNSKPIFAAKAGIQMPTRAQTTTRADGSVVMTDPETGVPKLAVAAERGASLQHVVLANGNIGAFDPRSGATRDTGQKAQAPASATDTGPLVQIEGPDGKPIYATRDEAKGKPAYVARDKPAAADLKYQREIKAKVPRLNAAVRRLDRLEQAADAIGKNTLFDGGRLDQYAIDATDEGRELISAQAQLLPEITALTRVPGVGSQSDLETRLQNLQFPSSAFPPETNRRNVAELKAFLNDLKDAYGVAETEANTAADTGQPGTPARPAAPTMKAGDKFKHSSGATVEIID